MVADRPTDHAMTEQIDDDGQVCYRARTRHAAAQRNPNRLALEILGMLLDLTGFMVRA